MDELTSLALAAREGDQVALAAFVRQSQAEVWRLCAHLASPAQADDLTQEVYLRALRALSTFRADSSARTWLLAITRRTVTDAIRSARRRRSLVRVLRPPPVAVSDRSEVIALESLLGRLDDTRRTAFVLTQVLGLTYAETAEICGWALGTVRSRVARARAELVEALAEETGKRVEADQQVE